MTARKQTILSGSGLGQGQTGDWFRISLPNPSLSAYDADAWAGSPEVQFDISDDPDSVAPPVNFSRLTDSTGTVVSLTANKASAKSQIR